MTKNPLEGKKVKRKLAFNERPLIEQKTMPYSIVADLMHSRSNINVAQLLTIPQYRNELRKALIPKRAKRLQRRVPAEKQTTLGKSTSSNTPMICKGQVAGWTVEIIIDSGSSTSIISKRFMEYINRKPNRISERMITGIHGNKKGSEGIVDDLPVHLGDVVVSANFEVIDTNVYNLVLGNDWLHKAKAIIDYSHPKITVSDGNRTIEVPCYNTTQPVVNNNYEDDYDDDEEDSDEDDDDDDNDMDNFISNYSLVVTNDKSPDHYFYRITPKGIEIDNESYS